MATLAVVTTKVRDYDSWKSVFDERQESRQGHGATAHRIVRSTEDPSEVTVSVEFDSKEDAQSYVDDPTLRDAMERAGIEGEPQIQVRDNVEYKEY